MMIGIISIAIGLVFAFGSVAKAVSFSALVTAIQEYRLVPGRFAGTAAAVIILAESVVAISHVSGIAIQWLMPVTVMLLFAFLVGTALVLKRGIARPCLCFGANSGDQIDSYSLVRISVLLLLESTLYFNHLSGGVSHAMTGGRPYDEVLLMILVSAMVVSILGWVLAIPKFWRVWKALEI